MKAGNGRDQTLIWTLSANDPSLVSRMRRFASERLDAFYALNRNALVTGGKRMFGWRGDTFSLARLLSTVRMRHSTIMLPSVMSVMVLVSMNHVVSGSICRVRLHCICLALMEKPITIRSHLLSCHYSRQVTQHPGSGLIGGDSEFVRGKPWGGGGFLVVPAGWALPHIPPPPPPPSPQTHTHTNTRFSHRNPRYATSASGKRQYLLVHKAVEGLVLREDEQARKRCVHGV